VLTTARERHTFDRRARRPVETGHSGLTCVATERDRYRERLLAPLA